MITVVIPAYNCRSTLGRTLASLVAQTDANFEVIVVDDCSTEDITPIVNDYTNKLTITYIRNEQNMGCGMSRQVGIDSAAQKHITFLDSDDIFMPYTVELFNSMIKSNPNIAYLHSSFYEQVIVDGKPALFLWKDNYTVCHGKLYNVDLVRRYNIRNSPEVKWADDSFFNSICSELMPMTVLDIPTVIWTNNVESITRRQDAVRDRNKVSDFLNAMLLSAEFVFKHKKTVNHLRSTIDRITDQFCLNDEEAERLHKLSEYVRRES